MESCAFYLQYNTTTNIKNLFGNWIDVIDNMTKGRIRVGMVLLFNNARHAQFLQVIHKDTHWINMWFFLLPENQRIYMSI
jgi:hypothetical protein